MQIQDLSQNEIKIIELLRNAEPYSTIEIFKKTCKDSTEYRINVTKSILLRKCIDERGQSVLE